MTSVELEDLRLTIFRRFAENAPVGEPAALAETLGWSEGAVRAGLQALATARHVVIDDDDRVLMAHPFASIPLGFSVMGRSRLWWGGCAWDSFAMPHLLPEESEVLVATQCPSCGCPHAWAVNRDQPPEGDEVAHFLVPVAHIWDDVVHSCANQRLFCSRSCVDAWLTATGNTRGYVMDLTTLWRLAQRWYEGRLERGYTRRDPITAAEYFREVGLEGPFWGL
jgi:hypothetical protein